MHEYARKRVKEYIESEVPEALQQLLHGKVASAFPEIGLQPFGNKFTDGFRLRTPEHAPKIPTWEDNISLLLSMGLANRTRAVQVLELMQNKIDHATEFLLAERGIQ